MKKAVLVLSAVILAAALAFASGSSEPSAGAGGAGGVNPSGHPIVKDKVTYTIMLQKIALKLKPMAETDVAIEYEKKTNVHIEWLEVPDTGWAEKVNLTFASLDLPDAMVPGPGSGQSYQAALDKLLLAINPYVDSWMPSFKKALAEAPFRKAMTFPDGNIYGIPNHRPVPWSPGPNPLWISTTWLRKLGIQVPETTEQFYAVLKAFKDRDPNGNGKADEIPLSLVWSSEGDNYMQMMAFWGLPDNSAHFVMRSGRAIYVPIQPEFKEGLRWFARLYAEGLLDQESLTQNSQQRVAKGKAETPILGSFFAFLDDLVVGADRVPDYAPIKPLKGSSRPVLTRSYFIAPNRTGAVLSAKVKTPEAFLRWWDMWLDNGVDELTAEMGPEGQAWKLYPDGRWEALLDATPSSFTSWGQWRQSIGFGSTWPGYYVATGEKRIIDTRSQRRWDGQKLYDAFALPDPYPPVIFTTEEQQEVATIATDLNNEVSTSVARFVAKGFSDKDFDDFVSRVKALKVDRYLAIQQAAYDRFNAAK